MDKRIATNILTLLQQTKVQGDEAYLYVEAKEALLEIVNAEDPPADGDGDKA